LFFGCSGIKRAAHASEPQRPSVGATDDSRAGWNPGHRRLLVLLFHFGNRPPGVPRFFTAPFALGWSGVDLFFVLSGFLITGILLDTRASSNYFSSFYTRRFLRIFPLYWLSLLVYFHVALPFLQHFTAWSIPGSSRELWYWFYLQNWLAGTKDVPVPLTHFWSLAIEEQFYICWPVVIYLVRRPLVPKVCVSLMLLSSGLRFACLCTGFLPSVDLYYFTPFRVEPLAAGALVAAIVRSPELTGKIRPLLVWLASGALFALMAVVGLTGQPSRKVLGWPRLASARSLSFTGVWFLPLTQTRGEGSGPSGCSAGRY